MRRETEQTSLLTVLAHLQRGQALLQSPVPPPDMPLQVEALLAEAIEEMQGVLGGPPWTEPSGEEHAPDLP